jgi:hypothetical protein
MRIKLVYFLVFKVATNGKIPVPRNPYVFIFYVEIVEKENENLDELLDENINDIEENELFDELFGENENETAEKEVEKETVENETMDGMLILMKVYKTVS